VAKRRDIGLRPATYHQADYLNISYMQEHITYTLCFREVDVHSDKKGVWRKDGVVCSTIPPDLEFLRYSQRFREMSEGCAREGDTIMCVMITKGTDGSVKLNYGPFRGEDRSDDIEATSMMANMRL